MRRSGEDLRRVVLIVAFVVACVAAWFGYHHPWVALPAEIAFIVLVLGVKGYDRRRSYIGSSSDMTPYQKACVEAALEVAENLLMEAPNYDYERRLVAMDDILRIVQELNASLHETSTRGRYEDPSPT